MAVFSGIAAAISAVSSWTIGLGSLGSFAIGNFLLRTAVQFGFSKLAQAIAGKGRSRFSIQAQMRSGGVVPRSFIFGRTGTAGSLVWHSEWGAVGKTPNAYYTRVVALSDLPISGLSEVYIDGKKVTLGAEDPDFGFAVTEYYYKGRDRLWVKFYDGTQTIADPFLVNTVGPQANHPYEATRVGHGVAYAVVTASIHQRLFTGLPEMFFVLDGVKLYDPSRDSSVGGSGTHRWSDPATWGGDGDHLPAVQSYHLSRGLTYNGEWFYGLQSVTAARLPVDHWIGQIEKCRAQVQGANGMEPTYRCGGEVLVSTEIGETQEQILTSCSGRVSEVGGFYKIHVGGPDAPVMSFDDGDILSTEPQSFTPFMGLADTVNGIIATYPNPEEGYAPRQAPPVYRPDLEAEDGGRRLMGSVALSFVPYPEQVQRLVSAEIKAARRAVRHTFSLPAEYGALEPGDVVTFASDRNGYAGKDFRVDGVIDLPNCDVVVDLTEVDPSDHSTWNSGTDYQTPDSAPIVLVLPDLRTVVGFSAGPAQVSDASGTGRAPAILGTWTPEANEDLAGIFMQGRVKATGAAAFSLRFDDVAEGQAIVSSGIVPGEEYEVRARPDVEHLGLEAAWTGWFSVVVPDIRLGAQDISSQVTDAITAAQATADASAARAEEVLAEAAGLVDALSAGTVAAIADVLEDLANVEAELDGRATASFDRISEMLLSARLDLAGLTSRMADAGIIVDPETGKVSIEAVSRIDDELGTVQADFNAALASIELRATYTDVAFAIAEAQLGAENMPILTNFDGRLSTAEADIDALEGAITLKADTLVVDGMLVTLTQAVADIDSLEAEIALRATQTQVDALAQDVSDAQLSLAAYDGAQFRLSLTDIHRAHQGLEEQALADLAALLGQHEAAEVQRTDLAYLRQDMVALVDEDRQSIASLRTELGVSYDSAVALVVQEASARASADAAEAAARQSLAVTLADAEAAILTETQARIAADAAEATAREALAVSVGDNQAAITAEAQARTDADQAAAVRADTIEANIGSISAVVVQNATAVSTLNGYAAATYTFRVAVDGAETGLVAVAANDPVNGPTADLRLFGRMIRLDGNVSVDGTFFTGTLLANEAWIRRAMIGDAEVDTLKVAGQAITVDFNASRNVQVGDTGYTSASDPWYDYMSFTIDLAKDAQSVSIDADLVMLVNSSARWTFRLIRSDTQGVLHSMGGDVAQQAFHLRGDIGALGKGLRTFILQYRLGVGLGIQNAKMNVGVKYR